MLPVFTFKFIGSSFWIIHLLFRMEPVILTFGVAPNNGLFLVTSWATQCHSEPLCVGFKLMMVWSHYTFALQMLAPSSIQLKQLTNPSMHVPSPVSSFWLQSSLVFNFDHVDVHDQPIETLMLYSMFEKFVILVCVSSSCLLQHYTTRLQSAALFP